MALTLSAWLVFRTVNVVTLVLLLAHLVGQYAEHVHGRPSVKGLVPLSNMNAELSIPAWFSSVLLLANALLFGAIGLHSRRSLRPRNAVSWSFLALFFTYLAVDEAVTIHERTIAPLRDAMGVTAGWLYFAWIVPGAVAVMAVGLVMFRTMRAVPNPARRLFLLGSVTFVVGAIGVEALSGWYLSTRGDGYTYEVIGGVEEVLELEGICFFLMAAITHLAATAEHVTIRFHSGTAP